MIALIGAALADDGHVTVSLEEWERRTQGAAAVAAAPPSVRRGGAVYRGAVDASANLVFTAELAVSLSGVGSKEVALLGPGAVVRGASVDGRPIALEWRDGAPLWRTERQGDVVVRVDAAIASGGSRSTPFDLAIVPAPTARVELDFPQVDLRPSADGALTSEVVAIPGGTRLVAELGRTDHVSVIGLRDLGSADAATARLYAETSHLLAVDEHELELFTVVRYDILYAPAQRFEVFVPEGLRVVSVSGEGAFGYSVAPASGGSVVVGETGSPMRNRYELSLELARELPDTATRFALPTARGVERESGWVGIEAPGRVRLDPVAASDGLSPVVVAELPEELRQASVSPLLQAFRLQGAAALELSAHRLPEVEARAERIDRVRARTVVSSRGRASTEIALQLRNRLQPGLALRLPPGAELVRATRDGRVVTPSRATNGDIVVPLRRSGAEGPLEIELVVAQDLGAPGPVGWTELALPALSWSVAELAWTVDWPDGRWTWAPSASVPDQALAGHGHWLADPSGGGAPLDPGGPGDVTWHRYWLPAGEAVSLRAVHLPWAVGAGVRVVRAGFLALVVPGALAWLGLRLVRGVRSAIRRRPGLTA